MNGVRSPGLLIQKEVWSCPNTPCGGLQWKQRSCENHKARQVGPHLASEPVLVSEEQVLPKMKWFNLEPVSLSRQMLNKNLLCSMETKVLKMPPFAIPTASRILSVHELMEADRKGSPRTVLYFWTFTAQGNKHADAQVSFFICGPPCKIVPLSGGEASGINVYTIQAIIQLPKLLPYALQLNTVDFFSNGTITLWSYEEKRDSCFKSEISL